MTRRKVDQAKSISAKLSALSHIKGVSYQSLSTSFLLERLLVRLVSDPKLIKCLVFKGGYVGLRVYNSTRYTIDLDALLLKADVNATLRLAALAIEGDINDGTWFALESQVELKAQGEYGGFRQTFRAGIGERPKDVKRAQIVNFDLGIGDPVIPGPVKVKTQELIGEGKLSWQVYPIETIIAEKLQTLVERAGDNSRSKDIFDLYFYLPKANSATLKQAICHCFEFRKTLMPPDLVGFLAKIDQSFLKRGWKSATSSLNNAPPFEVVFDEVLVLLEKTFHSDQSSINQIAQISDKKIRRKR